MAQGSHVLRFGPPPTRREGDRSIREAPCDVLSRRALARIEMICEYSGGQSSAGEGKDAIYA